MDLKLNMDPKLYIDPERNIDVLLNIDVLDTNGTPMTYACIQYLKKMQMLDQTPEYHLE